MSENADESKDALLDRAARALTPEAPTSETLGGTVGDVAAYLHAYYRHVAAEDLVSFGTDGIAAGAGQHAVRAAQRPQGRPVVRVLDVGGSAAPGVAMAAFGPVRTIVDIVTADMPYLVDSVTMG